MENTVKKWTKRFALSALLISSSSIAMAAGHMMDVGVYSHDQDVSHGTVTADMIKSETNGWLVVHRTDKNMKPGPVVGYAPLKMGENYDVSAILTEEIESGDMLMLMLHSEAGGKKMGVFEYTLGAKEDGPVRSHGKLVTSVITAK
ncbi:DUF7282 domain-containing protein [Vibrio palustris]|uniref:DUF7282 domain-containing protein n=1 Tax=Vibrio palustris TaxID=1918946 RepID=UPI001968686E|nr:hypothetical protein [Vibrio palustris]